MSLEERLLQTSPSRKRGINHLPADRLIIPYGCRPPHTLTLQGLGLAEATGAEDVDVDVDLRPFTENEWNCLMYHEKRAL